MIAMSQREFMTTVKVVEVGYLVEDIQESEGDK